MTNEALIRKDRPDIEIIADRIGKGGNCIFSRTIAGRDCPGDRRA
jgi:hypothetical protein